MSKEAGEYEQLKENYEITLNKSLSPYTLDSFDVAYIDVKDYVDGINECNNNLTRPCRRTYVFDINFFSSAGWLSFFFNSLDFSCYL